MAYINRHGTENAAFLVNEGIGRTISIGTDWTRLRLAILAEVVDTGSTTLISPKFAFGLCSGTGSLFLSSTTRHFVGITNISSDTWVINGSYYFPGITLSSYPVVKSASVEIETGSKFFMVFGRTTATNSINRLAYYIDFIKAATNPGVWDIRVCRNDTFDGGTFARDVTTSSFYTQLVAQTASLGGWTTTSSLVPVSESVYGDLDTVNIAWNDTHSLAVHEVAVYRFA